MSKRITAAICTYNRASVLPGAIESLLQQRLSPTDYEILIVDNGSTDGTPAVIQHYQATNANLRSCVAPVLGLSHARNLAVQQARGEIIAFLDDDAVAAPQWLAALLAAYDAFPNAYLVGGKILPQWQATRPAWLTDQLLPSLSVVDFGEQVRTLQEPQFLWGANFSLHRGRSGQSLAFRTDLGRCGANLIGEEEVAFQQQIRTLGGTVVYTPAAVVYHLIPATRLRRRYFVARAYGNGRTRALVAQSLLTRTAQLQRASRLMLLAIGAGLWYLIDLRHAQARLTTLRRLAFAAGYLQESGARWLGPRHID